MLYGELALAQRVLRDFIGTHINSVRIDSKLTYEQVREFLAEFMPELTDCVTLYTGQQTLFDAYGVERQSKRHWINGLI